MNDNILELEWVETTDKLSEKFGSDLELEGILFLIGVQELGKGVDQFSKHQKMDLMHIAICRLLEPYGYYSFKGRDEQGWPHWDRLQKIPWLSAQEQSTLMKRAIIDYFKEEA